MAKATRRIRDAGAIVEIVQYSHIKISDEKPVRRAKRQKTSAVMQAFNKKTSIQKFALMLAANFRLGDNVCHVTYDDNHLPKTRKEAERRFKYFRDKLRKVYDAKGVELIVCWSTENKHGDGRWHHHFVCTATGDDYENLRRAWIYGKVEEFKPLELDDKTDGYYAIADYFAKEAREKPGLRSWSYTRNARKPEVERDIVDENDAPQIPEGVIVFDNHSDPTTFGKYYYIRYMLPKAALPPRVKAKRKRKHKDG